MHPKSCDAESIVVAIADRILIRHTQTVSEFGNNAREADHGENRQQTIPDDKWRLQVERLALFHVVAA